MMAHTTNNRHTDNWWLEDIAGSLATGVNIDALSGTNDSIAINDGTTSASVVPSDAGYNGLVVNNGTRTLTFSTTTAGAQNLLANTDCRGYSWLTVVTTSVGSGLAWNGQFAPNSSGTYISTQTWADATATTGAPGLLGTTTAKIYSSPIMSDYFQLTVSALTSGTLSGYVILSSMPRSFRSVLVGSNAASGSTMPSNVFPIGVQGSSGNLQSTGSGASVGDGGSGSASISVDASLYNGSSYDRVRSGGVTGMAGVALQASPSGGYSYSHISTSTTTTVKSGSGTLHTICVNALGTVASSLTIYDNTAGSGTVVGVINTLSIAGTFTFDAAFTTGLTIVTTGTVAPDVTVNYK